MEDHWFTARVANGELIGSLDSVSLIVPVLGNLLTGLDPGRFTGHLGSADHGSTVQTRLTGSGTPSVVGQVIGRDFGPGMDEMIMFYTDAADKAATRPWHCPSWCSARRAYHEDELPINGWLHSKVLWTEPGVGTVETQILEHADGTITDRGAYINLEADYLRPEQARAIAAALVQAADLAETGR